MLRTIIVTLTFLCIAPTPHQTIEDGMPAQVALKPSKKIQVVDYPTLEQKSVIEAPVAPKPVRAEIKGNRKTWLRAAGIPQSEWGYVDFIVSKESGWQPCAYYPGQNNCNASPTTACGLVQQNPCGKIPGHWTDPVAALRWQKTYVEGRYGGYAQAVAYWRVNGHY